MLTHVTPAGESVSLTPAEANALFLDRRGRFGPEMVEVCSTGPFDPTPRVYAFSASRAGVVWGSPGMTRAEFVAFIASGA